jgi:uridine kinase
MQHQSEPRIIALAGKTGAGKHTLYEHVLKPRGFIRWQMPSSV